MSTTREQIETLHATLSAMEPEIKVSAQVLIHGQDFADLVARFEALRANTIPNGVLDVQLGLVKQALDNLKLYIPAQPVLTAP
jgi:hypothetical protein